MTGRDLKAGDLDQRLAFFTQTQEDDGHGNKIATELSPQFSLWANLRFLRGGEGVFANRLQDRQPILVAVWISELSRQIGSDWWCEISGQKYAIKETPRPAQHNSIFEFLVEKDADHA